MRALFGLALLLFILGLPTINIDHHLMLPRLDEQRLQSHLILTTKSPVLVATQYDIRLGIEIIRAEFYKEIAAVLDNAKKGDRVTFYLTGYGGYTQTTYQLINDIKSSKAYVTMIVEAPVYSAHAYLATAGNQLIMKPLSSLMFHSSSALGYDCSKSKGKLDRGRDAYKKCQQFINNEVEMSRLMVLQNPVLTDKEKQAVNDGYDVYITALDYYERSK